MKSSAIRYGVWVGILSLVFLACSERRGITPSFTPPSFLTYTTHMKPLFDASCTGCHGGSSPAGSYNMTTYAGILGNGTDATPNAIPGDAGSVLITRIQAGHFAWAGDQVKIDLLIQWVVQDNCREN